MTDKELIKALSCLKVETESLACMGCGHEHNCGIYGCAIIREAEDSIGALSRIADDRLDALTAWPWISVQDSLPETEDLVLAIVSGKPKSNITLIDAVELASYFEDGWLIEAYPNRRKPNITYWMPIPDVPGEKGELNHGF